MIEIVYKEEKKEANGNQSFFHLPKNIRQIGECKGSRKIYMEDYVYTFLRRMEEKNRETGRAGILLGRYNWMDGVSYLFIKSALEIENMEVSPEHISFTDQVWTEIHDTVQQYFKEQEILGWFLNLPEYSMEINEVILRAHLNHFGGNDKVLFLIEPTEKEEAFFSYDSSRLKRESGFYVYYEKNVEMQNYMIDKNKDESVDDQKEVPDKAVKDFRKLTTKKLEEKEKRSSHSLLYGVTACVAAASLALAFTYTDGGEKIKEIFTRFTVQSEQEEPEEPKTVSANGSSVQAVTGSPPTVTATPELTQTPEVTDAAGTVQSTSRTGQEEPTAAPTVTEAPTVTPSVTVTPSASPSPSGADAKETAVQGGEYIVQKGDTLTKISEQYYGNLQRIADICAANGITQDDIIFPGQKIVLPQ